MLGEAEGLSKKENNQKEQCVIAGVRYGGGGCGHKGINSDGEKTNHETIKEKKKKNMCKVQIQLFLKIYDEKM